MTERTMIMIKDAARESGKHKANSKRSNEMVINMWESQVMNSRSRTYPGQLAHTHTHTHLTSFRDHAGRCLSTASGGVLKVTISVPL